MSVYALGDESCALCTYTCLPEFGSKNTAELQILLNYRLWVIFW